MASEETRATAQAIFDQLKKITDPLGPVPHDIACTIENHCYEIRGIVIGELLNDCIVGHCEACGRMLLGNDEYVVTADDCYMCPECAPDDERGAQDG